MAIKIDWRLPPALLRLLDSPRVRRWFEAEPPLVALELSSRVLRVAAVGRDKSGQITLLRQRHVELPAGLVDPSLHRPIVQDQAALREVLRQGVEGLPGFDGRLALLLPDPVARVTFLDLEHEAPTRAETAELIRWKLKRTIPFRIEDARLSFQTFATEGGGRRAIVSVLPLSAIAPIEEALHALGLSAGLVDLSTLRLWNLLERRLQGPEDALLVNAGEDFLTLVVGREGVPLFLRSRTVAAGLGPSEEEIASELQTTLLYYQDRVKGTGIRAAWLRLPEAMFGVLAALLADRYGIVAQRAQAGAGDGFQAPPGSSLLELGPALGAVGVA